MIIDYKNFDQTHGSPFDRGSADSYYNRGIDPHWWPEGTYNGRRREMEEMSAEEVQAYLAGYEWNEKFGNKKDWG